MAAEVRTGGAYEDNRATPDLTYAADKKAHVSGHICNVDYTVIVVKYIHEKVLVNKCVLKWGGRGGVIDVLTGWEALKYLPTRWRPMLRTVLIREE